MFLALGYYVSESSGHNSEYTWWFRKRPALIREYCTPRKYSNWNPGEHAFILKGYRKARATWKKQTRHWLARGAPFDLKRGHEYAAPIINARLGGEPFVFNGNVPNTGLIDNLPHDACVEVPVLAHGAGLSPLHVGPLPPQCAALNNASIAVEEMAVEAALTGDPRLVYQAICYDPLSAAVLSLSEIRKMVQEMLLKNRRHLPTFRSVRV